MVRVDIAIQHTVRRDRDPTYSQLRADLALSPHIVVTDRETGPGNRTWITYRRCLETLRRSSTHILVLQDDVSLCRHFMPAVQKIAAARPDQVVALFLGNKPSSSVISYFQACDQEERYSVLDNKTWIPTQALLWPARLAREVVLYADQWYRQNGPDDELVGQWCRTAGVEPLATIPTLAQHEGAFAANSTLNASGGHYRRAVCHIGPHDPLDLSW